VRKLHEQLLYLAFVLNNEKNVDFYLLGDELREVGDKSRGNILLSLEECLSLEVLSSFSNVDKHVDTTVSVA